MNTENKPIDQRKVILKILHSILEPWIDNGILLNEQSNLLGDLGLDSVVILQLILGIEKEFFITLENTELDSSVFSKMANLIDVIEEKLNETY